MPLKTLLVCLTTQEHADTLMQVAVPLARKHGAHLVGLHTVEALMVYPGIAMHIPEPVFETFNRNQQEEASAIEAIFERHTRNEDFPSEWRLLRAQSASATERIVESARAADLVIMAREDKETDRFDQRLAQAQVIRESGRPVVVVPLGYTGPTIGENIVLGWSPTREAARAAHDLLMLADKKTTVTVVHINGAHKNELADHDTIDMAQMLSRHGLATTVVERDAHGHAVADMLEKVALEQGADMIATGAFGHSKAYDFVVGAATYALLRDAKRPVMFSK
jgi:nucleotide-binding universal stress UspA family protein